MVFPARSPRIALRWLALAACTVALLVIAGRRRPAQPLPAGGSSAPAASPRSVLTAQSLGRLPLHFEANQGQTDARVKFVARTPGGTVFLCGTEAVVSLGNAECRMQNAECRDGRAANGPACPPVRRSKIENRKSKIRMRLVGADARARMAGEERLPGVANYFQGNDPAKWRRNVPTYAKVRCRSVYPGVDVIYYGASDASHGNGQRLEHDFVLAPGADPRRISLAFDGANRVRVDAAGDLLIRAGREEVRLHQPVAYQEVDGRRRPVAVAWRLGHPSADMKSAAPGVERRASSRTQEVPPSARTASRRLGAADSISAGREPATARFELASYDRRRPLVIDPVLSYSTYFSGGWADTAHKVLVAPQGDIIVIGETLSEDFPTTPDALPSGGNLFVSRLSADGRTLLSSTRFGGSLSEVVYHAQVDPSGNLYLTGPTVSPDFPTTPDAFQRTYGGHVDVFLAIFGTTGSFYATYLGGSADDANYYLPFGMAVSPNGTGCIAGWTQSPDFPITGNALHGFRGVTDCFVVQFDAGGITYSTYLGGNSYEYPACVALDNDGGFLVSGYTASVDFSATTDAMQGALAGGSDAFLVRFDGTHLAYGTFLGGSADDHAGRITADPSGVVLMSGSTSSTNFPVTPDALQPSYGGGSSDAFIVRMSGSRLVYGTYFGGSGRDTAADATETGDCVYLAGFTTSTDLPCTPDALQSEYGGERNVLGGGDCYALRLGPGASRYCTYLGGSSDEQLVYLASAGSQLGVYVAGRTDSPDFPTTPDALKRSVAARSAAFLALLGPSGLSYSTYVGGSFDTSLSDLAVDASGRAILTGRTEDTDFPTTPDAFRREWVGWTSAFLTRFSPLHLAFTVQPRTTTAGAPLSVRVAVRDENGTPYPAFSYPVTLSLAADTGWPTAALAGTRTVSSAGGTADFAGLSINRASGRPYRLVASAPGMVPATSNAFLVGYAAPARLAFTVQPRTVAAGAPFTVKVAVQDSQGNLVSRAANPITLAVHCNPAGGTLSGAGTVAAVRGIATFPDLTLDKAGAGYTLSATAGGLAGTESVSFTVTAGPAARLAFVAQPRNTTAGAPISPAVKVAVQDALGNTVTDAADRVTLSLNPHPRGGTLSGITAMDAVDGMTRFADLSINRASGIPYALAAAAPGLAPATSTAFFVSPAR